jgi:hypothetical protein
VSASVVKTREHSSASGMTNTRHYSSFICLFKIASSTSVSETFVFLIHHAKPNMIQSFIFILLFCQTSYFSNKSVIKSETYNKCWKISIQVQKDGYVEGERETHIKFMISFCLTATVRRRSHFNWFSSKN